LLISHPFPASFTAQLQAFARSKEKKLSANYHSLSLAGCAVSGRLNDIQAINGLVNVMKAKLKIIFQFCDKSTYIAMRRRTLSCRREGYYCRESFFNRQCKAEDHLKFFQHRCNHIAIFIAMVIKGRRANNTSLAA
jgi:hypothetical protein